MSPDRLRPLFGAPSHDVTHDGYIDWNVYDRAPKGICRWWRLSYDIEYRKFYAILLRSTDDEAPLEIQCSISKRMEAFLVSLLPPEEIARATRASLGATG